MFLCASGKVSYVVWAAVCLLICFGVFCFLLIGDGTGLSFLAPKQYLPVQQTGTSEE